MRPRVAITLGDPRGIGPEVVAKTLEHPPAEADYVVVGPEALVSGLPAEHVVVGERGAVPDGDCSRSERLTTPMESQLPTWSPAPRSPLPVPPEVAGRLVGLSVERAVQLALDGDVAAIVTGPAEKRALHLAGYTYPGHTEWLAELAGGVDVAMMLAAGVLRVVLITTHIPLREVPAAVTIERVLRVGHITRSSLECWWGIEDARLAICALNPHAGESGLFGEEDATVLEPAAQELNAVGPLPADSVFVRAMRGEFDAVLTPYHDVGMLAVKVAGFGRGVNVTLGLPFIRTAPDHGTAFDIAGKGIADPGSMQEAVGLAVRLAQR
ncbi:MAG: 4-hydroxythreonine-4-phosphate dehydrogenase PdxA [Gemmatimonadales bacterium]|nr:4-hydroxythreonine-4-phosphate dehydrogenase PdxA [Gemmatimonadales bacterium]NIN50726.1 4-hydroxythreonine-4-phosphate dehydrogenase PdxA [Gemmatimonadales bacterium]NIP08190.1 4-hydroxythreonine-4-phosphate dehydrogenase PdxA [Gemmatimonadales bacterium]NIR01068.1 4-hydroxythreonine-4-phosphate dehydrogenase PdxA [Gemmatimonadales bacterium]NIS65147.1 4-hydroxythreonine-4-phosphate dehydrogenase PdxA [Gemmatimonadales bacterium]